MLLNLGEPGDYDNRSVVRRIGPNRAVCRRLSRHEVAEPELAQHLEAEEPVLRRPSVRVSKSLTQFTSSRFASKA